MDSYSIINPAFSFTFAEKEYQIKKANLEQVIQFQKKTKEITGENDGAADARLIAYAIYLVLHAVEQTITEDFVLKNARGDLDFVDVMQTLGFMNQQKIVAMQRTRNLLESMEKKNELMPGASGTDSTAA